MVTITIIFAQSNTKELNKVINTKFSMKPEDNLTNLTKHRKRHTLENLYKCELQDGNCPNWGQYPNSIKAHVIVCAKDKALGIMTQL